MKNTIFFESRGVEVPVKKKTINRIPRALSSQYVTPKKKISKQPDEAVSHHSNDTLFRKIFKIKKGRFILLGSFAAFCIFLPVYTNIQSYIWEKTRVFSVEGIVLYDLFLTERRAPLYSAYSSGEGTAENTGSGFVLPSFKLMPYKVKKGDSLFSISHRFNVSLDTILTANELTDAYHLQIGSTLQIPSSSGIFYTVKRGDSLSSIIGRYGGSLNDIADVNDLESATIRVGQKLFVPGGKLTEWERAEALGTLFKYPTSGRLTSRMGFRKDPFTGRKVYHSGIDLANKSGTGVYASQYGRVTYAGYKGNYGKMVEIVHPNGYSTLYAHLSRVVVKRGQAVRQGEEIGFMGNTGRSTGPHLHFEVHQNKKLLDPLKVLSSR